MGSKFEAGDKPSISLWAILGVAILCIATIVHFY